VLDDLGQTSSAPAADPVQDTANGSFADEDMNEELRKVAEKSALGTEASRDTLEPLERGREQDSVNRRLGQGSKDKAGEKKDEKQQSDPGVNETDGEAGEKESEGSFGAAGGGRSSRGAPQPGSPNRGTRSRDNARPGNDAPAEDRAESGDDEARADTAKQADETDGGAARREGLATGGSAPADGDGQAALELKLTDAANLAAQNDVLWISSLHGRATLSDSDEDDLEAIEVEIDADRLPALLKALRKLASDQGYGEVEGEPAQQGVPAAEEAADSTEARRISGYLPDDEAPETAPPAPPLADEAGRTLKLVIRAEVAVPVMRRHGGLHSGRDRA
jgi:hypothetical protein